MEFVHPEILWGLSALAIPIIIHLLHFRRFRRVAFSQVAFLNEVQKDTRATQRIRHWWILIARLLAFAAIILAFAQPQLPPENASAAASEESDGHTIALYIDNSHSMQAQGEEGQLLQVARNKAEKEIPALIEFVKDDSPEAFLQDAEILEKFFSVSYSIQVQYLVSVQCFRVLGKLRVRHKLPPFF